MATPVPQLAPQPRLLGFFLENYFGQMRSELESLDARAALDYEIEAIGIEVMPSITEFMERVSADMLPAIAWYCDFITGRPAEWLRHPAVHARTPLRFFDSPHEPTAIRSLKAALLIEFSGAKEPEIARYLLSHQLYSRSELNPLGRRIDRMLEAEARLDAPRRYERNRAAYSEFVNDIRRQVFLAR